MQLSCGLLKVPPEGVRGVTGESEGWLPPLDMAGSRSVDISNECSDSENCSVREMGSRSQKRGISTAIALELHRFVKAITTATKAVSVRARAANSATEFELPKDVN